MILPRKTTGNGRPAGGRREGVATILLVVGGSFRAVTRYARIAAADIILYFDVEKELESSGARKGVHRVPLAKGHTVGTLIALGCRPALRRFLESMPAVNLGCGLGQLPPVGHLASAELLADPEFRRFVRHKLLDACRILLGGVVAKIDLVVMAGVAGGTGGPTAPQIAEAVATVFRDHTSAVVKITMYRLGALTFTGLGENIGRNAAVMLDRDLEIAASRTRHPRGVHELNLVELPPVEDRSAERDSLAVQLVQAVRAWDLREPLDREILNLQLQNEMGNVRLLRADWWTPLPARLVAAEVGREYLPALRGLLEASPPDGTLREIRVEAAKRFGSEPAGVDALLGTIRKAGRVRPQGLVERCLEAPVWEADTVLAVLRGYEPLGLTGRREGILFPPASTEEEFRKNLSRMRAIRDGIRDAIRDRRSRLEAAKAKLGTSRSALEKALSAHFPSGLFGRLSAAVGNPPARLETIKGHASGCLSLAAAIAKLEAELSALKGAERWLASQYGAERRRVERLIEAVAYHCGANLEPGGAAHVKARPLSGSFAEMLSAASSPDREEMGQALASSAALVTLAGLAMIAGAPEIQALSVAERLVRHDSPVSGPPWGGEHPLGAGRVRIVLPPVAPGLLEEVAAAVALVDSGLTVVAADTAEAGANILRVEWHSPRNREDVMTRPIQKDLEDAWADPVRFVPDWPGDGEPDPEEPEEVRVPVGAEASR